MPSNTANDTTLTTPLLANFAERASRLAEDGPDWLRQLRRDGRARFEALGFPTTRQEEWRTTNVTSVATTGFVPAAEAHGVRESDLPAPARLDLGGPRLVFVDGRYCEALSSPGEPVDGVRVGSLARALAEDPERVRPLLARRRPENAAPFVALNTAFVEDGAAVLVADGVHLDRPIQLVFVSLGLERPTASHPRTLVAAGRDSHVQVVESHVGLGDGVYLSNAVTDLVAGDAAHVEHYRLQSDSPRAYHLSSVESRQGRDSRCDLHNLNLGGLLVRHDVVGVLDGEGADCRLNGLYLTSGSQHVDNHTILDHAKPHGDSRELYKGILDGNSRAVFNGRIIVREDAQKTDAKQSNPNLLLSRGALAQTRPQLEIYADDVKCTHGATIGRVDEEAVFYLQSRGIARDAARNMLVFAFAGEVIDRVGPDALRDWLARSVAERLPRIAA